MGIEVVKLEERCARRTACIQESYRLKPAVQPRRASALLCKAFMHLDVREGKAKSDFRILWIQILDLLDRLMNIDKNDQLVSDFRFVWRWSLSRYP